MKNFYDSLKEVYGPTASGSLAPLLSADGSTLINDKENVLERWAEHFDSELNRPSSTSTGSTRQCHRISRMPLSHTSTNAKETAKPMTIIVEFTCCPSQARSWLEFCSIASSHTSSKVSYLRGSVASSKNAELSVWCLLLDSYKRSVRNRTPTTTPPSLI